MRVAFDSQIFLRQRYGGIARVFVDLIKAFTLEPALGVDAVTPWRWINNQLAVRELGQDRALRTGPSWLPRAALYGPAWLRGQTASGADILHYTYYARRFLGKPGPSRRVTTVHDMIPEIFRGSGIATGSHLAKRQYVWSSDLVICVSDATRHDLETIYGAPPCRLITIPNAVSPIFAPRLPPLPGWPSDYLLYVGSRTGYKDFHLLAPAIEGLKKTGLAIPLMVVGSPLSAHERESFHRYGVAELVHQHALGDLELSHAYSNCTALVQTSSYEGFGLTPLEAMASGAPVVIANSSAMPEVGGDVARYFTPGSAASLSEAIAQVLDSDSLRAQLGTLGIDRASNFTVARMASRTASAYRSLLG